MKPAKACAPAINGGSSSIKFTLLQADRSLRKILEGTIDRIGLPEATFAVKALKKVNNSSRQVAASDHTTAVGALIDWIEERIGCCASTAVGQF